MKKRSGRNENLPQPEEFLAKAVLSHSEWLPETTEVEDE